MLILPSCLPLMLRYHGCRVPVLVAVDNANAFQHDSPFLDPDTKFSVRAACLLASAHLFVGCAVRHNKSDLPSAVPRPVRVVWCRVQYLPSHRLKLVDSFMSFFLQPSPHMFTVFASTPRFSSKRLQFFSDRAGRVRVYRYSRLC